MPPPAPFSNKPATQISTNQQNYLQHQNRNSPIAPKEEKTNFSTSRRRDGTFTSLGLDFRAGKSTFRTTGGGSRRLDLRRFERFRTTGGGSLRFRSTGGGANNEEEETEFEVETAGSFGLTRTREGEGGRGSYSSKEVPAEERGPRGKMRPRARG